MRGRKRKTQVDTRAYQQNYRTASESYVVGQTFMGITENNLTGYDQKEYGLFESRAEFQTPLISRRLRFQ